MDEILFLAHRIPYPPDKGDKIRSYNILRSLCALYRVHLGCFVDDAEDWQHVETLSELCGETHFAPLGRPRFLLRAAGGLLGGEPLSVATYGDEGLRTWVQTLIDQRPISCVYAFSSAMAQFVDPSIAAGIRTVLDFVDVDSDKWRSRSRRTRWPLRSLYRREANLLLAHDRAAAEKFDLSLFVSESEAELFRSLAPDAGSKLHVVRNGLDADFFNPENEYPNPFAESSTIVFCGAMNYWPNEEAVIWFANEVQPRLRQEFPALQFAIVGRSPSRRVRALQQLEGVNVVGAVPDVRPYLAHASVVVVPLRDSPGVANKVLEGMAMARPVVATPQAVEGLKIERDKEVVIADGVEDQAMAVLNILSGKTNGPELGADARAAVLADYDWKSTLAELSGLIEGR